MRACLSVPVQLGPIASCGPGERADSIIPGSPCTIRPNRGEDYAAIEWDLYFAKGKVTELRDTEAVVTLTDVKDSLIKGDYCDVDADIPANLANADVGRIAIFDIRLLSYESDVPFFELRDLLQDSSQTQISLRKQTGSMWRSIWNSSVGIPANSSISTGPSSRSMPRG